MALQVEIEKHSGFCGGVIRAIGTAEKFLSESDGHHLFSLGAIVHNEAELTRLGQKGLVTIQNEELCTISRGETLLIRAHGEPPATYSLAERQGLKVIDCTCPVVLRLQKSIREAYERLRPSQGQLIIFGKIGHAEVLGLLGQVDGDALVVESMKMLEEAVIQGKVRFDKPMEVFSQTTKSPVEYAAMCDFLRSKATQGAEIHQTICSQVASRHSELTEFARRHDVIVFVAGVSSSNGKVLFDLCKSQNPSTYHISSKDQIRPEWFEGAGKVGICGATSTPRWLLDDVAQAIASL